MGYLDYWRWYFWLVDKSTEEKERRQMKNLITILILFAFGCGKSETKTETETVKTEPKPLSPEEKLVGSYEAKKSAKHVLLENGKSETWILGVKRHGGTWKIAGKEVHIGIEKLTHVCKIEPNGDLTLIAKILDGKRTDVSKDNQYIWEKLK